VFTQGDLGNWCAAIPEKSIKISDYFNKFESAEKVLFIVIAKF